jgi:hypothetical protein
MRVEAAWWDAGDSMRIGSIRIRLFLAWYDCWVGWYWSREKRTLYMCPLPMLVLALEFGRSDALWKGMNKALLGQMKKGDVRVIIDETTNTPEDVENNILRGRIEIGEEEENHGRDR